MVTGLVLIPALPFAGFLLNAGFGRRISKTASAAVACGAMLVSFLVSVWAVWSMLALEPEQRRVVQTVFTWISSGSFIVDFQLALDPLSALMILVVTGIGSLIHIYSTAYMHEESDSEYARYFSYLNLFAAFMLVLGANFLVMFLGWEGVGLCSYLLVGFWYQKKAASDAGKKAFIVNRVGDVGFILGVLLLFERFSSVDFQEVARAAALIRPEVDGFGTISIITLLLFIGATGKSAQIPLYVWLPDAMEGPTPVSALIHAATMVTAGVYMIGRNAVLFSRAPHTLAIVAVIGVATALMAGTIGLVQNDIKRVLAYSTVSQLGYMFLAMGVGASAAGVFHLYTHAFFKALLFLGSGAVIHALAGEQDMRKMGGLRRELPITFWTFLMGAIAISGVPFFAGFYSKDEILGKTFESGHTLLWAVGLFTAFLTATYMFRVLYLTFFGERADAPSLSASAAQAPAHLQHGAHLHDAPPAMALALIVLAIGSVVAGYVSFGGRFEHFLEPSFSAAALEGAGVARSEVESMLPLVLSIVAAFAGIGTATYFFFQNRPAADRVAEQFSGVHRVLEHKYYVDELYDAVIVDPIHLASEEGLWKFVDATVIDGAVNGVGDIVGGLSDVLRLLQTGSVRAYAASLFLGVVVILGYYLSR